MIKVKNVTKIFDSFTALDTLSLNVEKGSIYGLVGPNGSGKTTIMKAIAGIYKVDNGEISIDGQKSFENVDIKNRTIYISDELYFFNNFSIKQMSNFHLIPVVGKIACGTPILAEQNIDSYMSISGNFLGAGEFFVLVAQGDSMINAGIDDGDYVVIRKQNTANEGQIVVALIDGEEATLKRFYIDKKKKKIRLHPENDNLKDMFYDTIDIQGIVVKVIKDVE